MEGDQSTHGYDLLARLRRLESRIARVRKRWRSFRNDPGPERFDEFREAFAAADRALDELAHRLGGDADAAASGGGAGGATRADAAANAGGAANARGAGSRANANDAALLSPEATRARDEARSVVEAGRTLDHMLAEVSRAWGFLRRDPDADGLAGLADRLARAEAAAAVLRRTLPSGSHGGAEPEAAREVRPETENLDALLTRIRDDWNSLRRGPALDRAGVLRTELAEARRLTDALRDHVGSSAAPDRRTARRLAGGNDTVRFGPYRDAFTGLYNREGFDALAGAELKRCRRYARSFGLLLLEIQAADLAELRGTIDTLQSLLRGYDLISRYSDRLLVVGLPEAPGPETRRIAARLLRALEGAGGAPARAWPIRGLSYALMPDDGPTLSALLAKAEERLGASST